MPLTPSGLTTLSSSSTNIVSILVDVGVDRHVVVLEVRVHDAAVAVVDLGRLLQGHADAPDDAADLLAVRRLRVDDLAAGRHLDGARDADVPRSGVDLHLDELRAVRQRRVLLALRRRRDSKVSVISVRRLRFITSAMRRNATGRS
jgi:hypothetical protein